MSHKTRAAYKRVVNQERRMVEDKRYNGWTNYETWCVNLWLTNEEPTMKYWEERARDAWSEASIQSYFSKKQDATYKLAGFMKDDLEEGAEPFADKGVYTDLLNAALSEVNWNEIAEHFIEAIMEDETT